MRGLLILFLTAATIDHGFGWAFADALRLYATYTALVYLLPVLGGFIGDMWLGRRRAVLVGAMLMMVGHFLMAVPGVIPTLLSVWSGYPVEAALFESGLTMGMPFLPEGAGDLWSSWAATNCEESSPFLLLKGAYLSVSWAFYSALGLILLGTGLFKSNMATMVGELYTPGDQRRDAGYTIYYAGANIGAFIANLVAGTVGEYWGWHWGFSVAGLGMVVGCVSFYRMAPALLSGVGDHHRITREEKVSLSAFEWRRVVGILLMSAFTIVFWAGFEQGGGLLSIMVRDSVERQVLGVEVPVTWFQSLNPFFIFLFAPLFVAVWGALESRNCSVHATYKYAFGLFLMSLSFLLLLGAQREVDHTGSCSAWWLVAVFAVQTIGELAISPVSKALVSRHAPERIAAPMMGAEFACYAAGAWFAGLFGAFAVSGQSSQVFWILAISSTTAAIVCLAMKPVVDRLLEAAR
jgi:POT family proton-dependent oligopeptide transporter